MLNVPKYDGKSVTLMDWAERLRAAARLYQVPPQHQADLALSLLEGDARAAVVVLPVSQRATLEDIIARLETLYGDTTSVTDLRKKFYTRSQREDESVQQYSVALQRLWNRLSKKDQEGCAAVPDPDRVLRDQYVSGLKNRALRRSLRDYIRMEPHTALVDVVREAIEWQREGEDGAHVSVHNSTKSGPPPKMDPTPESAFLRDFARDEVYERHFAGSDELENPWLTLTAANNLPIPVVGMTWLDMELFGKSIPRQAVLVVPNYARPGVPVIIGMNILRELDGLLLREMGTVYWERVGGNTRVQQSLQQLQRICRQKERVAQEEGQVGTIRSSRGKPLQLPPRQELTLPLEVKTHLRLRNATVIVEPLSDASPASNWMVGRTVCRIARGCATVRLMNLDDVVTVIPPATALAAVHVIRPQDVTESEPHGQSNEPEPEETEEAGGTLTWLWQQLKLQGVAPDPESEQALRALLQRYLTAFASHEEDYGCTDAIEHAIHTRGAVPVRERYRSIPPALYQEVKDLIQKMLEGQVIRESTSPWAAPIVLVRKKDGTLRFCIDYRRLNACTHRDAYPLPRVEESLTALRQAQYFTTLDLASGYWQVPVREEDKEKTAFITPMGLFECNRMPFGLNNAPSTFQRLMEHCLGDMNFESIMIYLDDIVVYSSTFPEHLGHLEAVLSRLTRFGLKLKPTKCRIARQKINYLGHVVSPEGVAPDPSKIQAVMDWPPPSTSTEVRAFLGMVGYYRRYIQDFAKIAGPLHELLRGQPAERRGKQSTSVANRWGPTQEQAFQQLKERLTTAPILAFADYSQPFQLYTDASLHGLGAVLSQKRDGVERVIAYGSRSLRPAERNPLNYSSFRLELLAVVWAVTERFAEYLTGSRIEIYTDNNPLAYLHTAKLGALEQRWVARLARFDYIIRYKPGRNNGNADALSRNPTTNPVGDQDEEVEEVEIPPLRVASRVTQLEVRNGGPEVGELYSRLEWQEKQRSDKDLKHLHG
ncbi:uncharacterized protein LOC142760414 [Rhinoderma darwinii]|uniref:uncharacterized protein LOC142760414 n=1 Tax=Rhinoderma darwinii TaxID=43563 RepID=UPI003F67E336